MTQGEMERASGMNLDLGDFTVLLVEWHRPEESKDSISRRTNVVGSVTGSGVKL